MWVKYNPNPKKKGVGDCTVRAVTKATGQSWEEAYSGMAIQGFLFADMPSANNVWGSYLKRNGFTRNIIPNTCPDCYTAEDFCRDHPIGTFVLAFDGHVATVHDGDLYDSWDSSMEVPIYYFSKENE
jgi:hypothetical protein